MLAALAVQPGRAEFTAVEALLGGSFAGLAAVRGTAAARIDTAGLSGQQTRDWLAGLPIGPDAEVHVAWAPDRIGARISFGTLTAHIGDLWFPAVDDVVCVLHSGAGLLILVLGHEEVITLSCLDPAGDTGGLRRAAQASLPGPGPAQDQHVRD
jgi:hypothetical protein